MGEGEDSHVDQGLASHWEEGEGHCGAWLLWDHCEEEEEACEC